MKFLKELESHLTPEWRKQYINYGEIKEFIYTKQEAMPRAQEKKAAFLSIAEDEFFSHCEGELRKIVNFFLSKLTELQRKLSEIEEVLPRFNIRSFSVPSFNIKFLTKNKTRMRRKDIQVAFTELYLEFILLQNFKVLNYTGFRKILKKHDKVFNIDSGSIWMKEHVDQSELNTDKLVEKSIEQIEDYMITLEGGDRKKAMLRLRVPPLGHKDRSWATFLLGLFAGAFIAFLIQIGISLSSNHEAWHTVVRVYRGPFLINLFLFLIGINVYGWRISGVNHVLIFEFDPRRHLETHDILEMSAFLSLAWAASILVFLKQPFSIPPYASPFALHIFYLVFLFNPFKILWHSGRFWFLKTLFRLLWSPFHPVTFSEFWLADQLSSVTAALLDFEYTYCIYISYGLFTSSDTVGEYCNPTCYCASPLFPTRPIIRWLPSLIRLIQCIRRYKDTKQAHPHLTNAGKYCCSTLVILCSVLLAYTESINPELKSHKYQNPFLYIWVLVSTLSSIYAYIWDTKMDWGLLDTNVKEYKLLRPELIYKYKAFYYFAIIEDCILRFTWTISLSISELGYVPADILTTLLAPLEMFRRCIWNFLRLENEHLNNCGQFRAVRDISLGPLGHGKYRKDQEEVLQIMDLNDGMEQTQLRQRKSSRTILAETSVASKLLIGQNKRI